MLLGGSAPLDPLGVGKQIGGQGEVDCNFGASLGFDLGFNLGFDLGLDLGFDLGLDLGFDLRFDFGFDLGLELGLVISFVLVMDWHHAVTINKLNIAKIFNDMAVAC